MRTVMLCVLILAALLVSSAAAEERVKYVLQPPLPLSAKLLTGNGQVMHDFYRQVADLQQQMEAKTIELSAARAAINKLHDACVHDASYTIRQVDPDTFEEDDSGVGKGEMNDMAHRTRLAQPAQPR